MQGLALRLQLPSRVRGRLPLGWASVLPSDRAIFRAILALIAALAVTGATIDAARAQQYFNGAHTTPNGAINGGGGVWNNTTTNWTNATGAASNPYDPAAASVTVFGASGSSTPATGGTVVVSPGGVRLTGTVDFNATGNNSIYTIRGGNLTVAAGGTSFNVDNVAASGASAVIASSIIGSNGISVFGPGGLLLTGVNGYAGGTFICSCASLQLGDGSHTASIVGAVVNDGLFNVFNANTSGITSIFVNGGTIFFLNSSSAASAHITNQFGTTFFGTPGGTDSSTAGNATITNNNGGTIFAAMTNAGTAHITNVNGGGTEFFEKASAASATIVNNNGGFTSFGSLGADAPTAGHATITNNSGGETDFNTFSTAGNATIITNSGGSVTFFDTSTGGNAQFITNGAGFVDFSGSVGPGFDGRITAGSIAGSGTYYIGAGNTLIVGSNNLSTTVSGVIADFFLRLFTRPPARWKKSAPER